MDAIIIFSVLGVLCYIFWIRWGHKFTLSESDINSLNAREVKIITNEIQTIQSKLIDYNEKHRQIANKLTKCIASIEKLLKQPIVLPGSLFHNYILAMRASNFEFIGRANTYMISILEACNNNNERLELFMYFANRPAPSMLNF